MALRSRCSPRHCWLIALLLLTTNIVSFLLPCRHFHSQTTFVQGHLRSLLGQRCVVRDVLPFQQTAGGADLLEESTEATRLVAELSKGLGLAEDLELVIPQEGDDLGPLADLVDESFERFIEDRKVADDGPLAAAWNGWVSFSERQLTLGAVRKRLASSLSAPTLRKPRGMKAAQNFHLGVMLVRKGKPTELLAYFELCFQPTMESPTPMPYLLNLCVARSAQRQGFGRAMLKLAEAVVLDGWNYDQLHLDTDADDAAVKLYKDTGYVKVKRRKDPLTGGAKIYMRKLLPDGGILDRVA